MKLGAAAIPASLCSIEALAAEPAAAALADNFPSHPAAMVRETVIVAHFNFNRLKELVDARPALARAAIDWGFGDWEDALGAASHMGNRAIAEYLIAKGARPSLFSAAMLGQLDVVKALIAASPGAQRIRGPHSISLLEHAKKGGPAAKTVYDYLQSLGDADTEPEAPLSEEARASILGNYRLGSGATDVVDVTLETKGFPKPQLLWTRKGTMGRPLYHLGNRAFYPAGAREVRIEFAEQNSATVMTVRDADTVLTATRT